MERDRVRAERAGGGVYTVSTWGYPMPGGEQPGANGEACGEGSPGQREPVPARSLSLWILERAGQEVPDGALWPRRGRRPRQGRHTLTGEAGRPGAPRAASRPGGKPGWRAEAHTRPRSAQVWFLQIGRNQPLCCLSHRAAGIETVLSHNLSLALLPLPGNVPVQWQTEC